MARLCPRFSGCCSSPPWDGLGGGGGAVGRRLGPEGGAPGWGQEESLPGPRRPAGWDAQARAAVRAPGRTAAAGQVWVLLIQEVGAQAVRGARAPRPQVSPSGV